MTKYLLLALLIAWLIYASPWKRVRHGQAKPPVKPSPPPAPQSMVACAHCGVHLPVGEVDDLQCLRELDQPMQVGRDRALGTDEMIDTKALGPDELGLINELGRTG
ncbi:MAG: hypothetical protein EOP38_28275 [Rubrivivax sp.]|nr:MAG: hypothetical protein EOP38_28275 [Rubrivivax sp.]